MPKPGQPSHVPARLGPPSPGQLVSCILEEPRLVAALQALPAPVLGQLVSHVGLEDAGDLVALATPAQLRQLLDDDLWRNPEPGQEERFDPERFTVWLEVMLEAGEEQAAQRFTELPEELVTLALHQQVLVVDLERLAVHMSRSRRSDDEDLLDKALESSLGQELEQYFVISRRHEGWDAVLALLLALDRYHHAFLQRLLDRLCYASTEVIEDSGGLYTVLTAGEMAAADAAGERAERRARSGYVAPEAAASFLALARRTDPRTDGSPARDAVTRAYFRDFRPDGAAGTADAARPGAGAPPSGGDGEPAPPEGARLAALLRSAGIGTAAGQPDVSPAAPLLPAAAATDVPAGGGTALLRGALAALEQQEPVLHARRMRELGYLANVLLAGCRVADRRFRPLEAAEAVVAVCSLGLEQTLAEAAEPSGPPDGPRPPDVDLRRAATVLGRLGADRIFRLGWYLLHREVSLPVLRALAEASERAVRSPGRTLLPLQRTKLERASAALRAALAAGKPWAARSQLATLVQLGVIDASLRTTLAALLDEYPGLPAAPAAAPAAAHGIRTQGPAAALGPTPCSGSVPGSGYGPSSGPGSGPNPGSGSAPGPGSGRQPITGEPELRQVRELVRRLERSAR